MCQSRWWPVSHLGDGASDLAACGRRPPAALMTILPELVTCPECAVVWFDFLTDDGQATGPTCSQHVSPA